MKPSVLLLNNAILTLFFLIEIPNEIYSCDTKWIRYMYMVTCGKKKRESVSAHNETFFRDVPRDFEGALKYFRDRDPFNPMFSNDAFLYAILQEDEKSFQLNSHVPKLLIPDETTSPIDTIQQTTTTTTGTPKTSSVLINKLLITETKPGNSLGIPGFPDQWDIDEIIDEKINENHRREIDRLIEECCKIPPVTTCNGNTFLGACK